MATNKMTRGKMITLQKKFTKKLAEKKQDDQQELAPSKIKKNPPKPKRPSMREVYKALREEQKDKVISPSDNYEQDLINNLFGIDKEEDAVVVSEESNDQKQDQHRSGLWDYVLEDEIQYFDPACSYELTGYRPIDETHGLDFDPEWFTEAARTYEQTGSYTEYPRGSKPYADYWYEQIRRCKEGYTVNGYTITGDNYFYLNFYRMQTIVEGRIAGRGREEKFPSFFAKQYEFFHYCEMAEKLHKDVCTLKCRGVGFSEIVASLLVRPYTTNRGYKSLLTAPDNPKLKNTKDKCWKQLNWLDTNTNGGLQHVRQKINNDDCKRASKVSKDGVEFGWGSEINTVVADSADKIRGDRLDRLVFEECFGAGTKVRMADFSVKKIEDIKVGDFVMGIDGTPQEVEYVTRGLDQLYRVKQNFRKYYVVNSKHKLYLVDDRTKQNKLLTCDEYKRLHYTHKPHTFGCQCSTIVGNNTCELDPYFFGVWLVTGEKRCITINLDDEKDKEVKDYILNYFKTFDNHVIRVADYPRFATIQTNKRGHSYTLRNPETRKNAIIPILRKYDAFAKKHIPWEAITSPLEYKLKLLAGIIDGKGIMYGNRKKGVEGYQLFIHNESLAYDICALLASCGFKYTITIRRYSKKVSRHKLWCYIWFSGDLMSIPLLNPNKKYDYNPDCSSLDNYNSIAYVVPHKYDYYYGFKLKEYGKPTDNLFLLEDLTIVHNCGSNKILAESWIKSNALVELGGEHFGTRVALGCVCAGTKVWTKDGRHVNIEDLKQTDGILGFHAGECLPEDIAYIKDPAEKECVRITTDYGILECSNDHPIFKRVCRSKRIDKEGHRIKWFDYAWFRADEVVSSLLYRNVIGICDKIDVWGNVTLPDPYHIGFYLNDVNNQQCFSNYYLSLTKTDSITLLAGIFDAKGKIIGKRKIEFTQSSKERLLQIQELLQKFGVYSKIYKQEPKIRPDRKDRNPWYNLYIEDTVSIVNFYDEIPITVTYKKERLKKIAEERRNSIIYKHYYTYKGIREAHVRKVEHIGKRTIYNLTASGTHTYLANNFITHNTGGQDMALEGLSKIFSNPEAYNVLPYKNYDTDDGNPQYTAFFIPAHKFSLMKQFLDNRGVTNSAAFKEFYEKERKKMSGRDLLDYCAEHCFHPQEALFKQGDGFFDPIMLSDRLTQIRIQKMGVKPERVDLLWDCPRGVEQNPRNKVKLVPNNQGKILIYEQPLLDASGSPYNNLYVAGIDAIDQGSADSSTTKDVSDFCIVIKKRILGTSSSNYVAIYKDRPRDIVTAYENAMKLCVYYNCKAMLEHTKISIIMYFRSKKKDNLFMKRPKSTMPDVRRGNSNMIGYPATETYLKHGLELVKRFVDESCYQLSIDEMLEQLLKYSWEFKRKFDIVAAMIAAELGDEDLLGFTPKLKNETTLEWKDFGWYTDSYGTKHYGIIPSKGQWTG